MWSDISYLFDFVGNVHNSELCLLFLLSLSGFYLEFYSAAPLLKVKRYSLLCYTDFLSILTFIPWDSVKEKSEKNKLC